MDLAGQAFHAPIIRGVKGMELACILERRTENAKKRYPEVRIARTLDEMLADKALGLMRSGHAERFAFFLHQSVPRSRPRRGRSTNRMTPTMKEAEELVSLAKNRGRLMTVYQDRRWDGAFLTVKKLVNSGALGDGRRVRSPLRPLSARCQAWRVARSGFDFPAAGVLWDLGPHCDRWRVGPIR